MKRKYIIWIVAAIILIVCTGFGAYLGYVAGWNDNDYHSITYKPRKCEMAREYIEIMVEEHGSQVIDKLVSQNKHLIECTYSVDRDGNVTIHCVTVMGPGHPDW